MPWYKAGTVSCTQNSNAVIGTATAFIANSRVGDAFRGPDGNWYEVTNIASDTAMSISPNYQGLTTASAGYALAPLQGYVKESADRLRSLVDQFGEQFASLGTTGNYDVLPVEKGGTGATEPTSDFLSEGVTNKFFTSARAIQAALAGVVFTDKTAVVATDSIVVAAGKLQAQMTLALPKAGGTMTGAINDAPPQVMASAATVDIGAATSNVVSITGTTTITSLGTIAAGARRTIRFVGALLLTHNAASLILPGGANITTAANDSAEFLSLGSGNWICLRYSSASGAYNRTNSVGTVSQAGGVPTGAIVESGSNANGDYTKWADGTMICTRVEASGRALANALGAIFIDVIESSKPYAQTFVGVPREHVSVTGAEFGVWWMGVAKNTATLSSTGFLISPIARGFSTFSIVYSAKGRWF